MNANELADELNRKCTGRLVGFAATMLRQQQAEIEALEKEVKHWQDAFHKGVRT